MTIFNPPGSDLLTGNVVIRLGEEHDWEWTNALIDTYHYEFTIEPLYNNLPASFGEITYSFEITRIEYVGYFHNGEKGSNSIRIRLRHVGYTTFARYNAWVLYEPAGWYFLGEGTLGPLETSNHVWLNAQFDGQYLISVSPEPAFPKADEAEYSVEVVAVEYGRDFVDLGTTPQIRVTLRNNTHNTTKYTAWIAYRWYPLKLPKPFHMFDDSVVYQAPSIFDVDPSYVKVNK